MLELNIMFQKTMMILVSSGTFFHASNRRWPYNLPRSRNILRASDVQGNAYITTKRLKDGYQWDILFNSNHKGHEYMYYWFGLQVIKHQLVQ